MERLRESPRSRLEAEPGRAGQTGEQARFERITGPWNGIFIAAYTAELDGQFYGYAKLCDVAPRDVWSAKALVKVTAAPRSGGAQAMRAAENRALQIITALRAPSARRYWSALFQ